MSSFGGETPIATVTVILSPIATYTVPAGKYFIGMYYGKSASAFNVNVDGNIIFEWTNGRNVINEIILLSGQVFSTTQTIGGNSGYLTGRLYNNPV